MTVNAFKVRATMEKYVKLLRQLSPDMPSLESRAEAILSEYKHSLEEEGVEPDTVQLLTSYESLCFAASIQAGELTDISAVSKILISHLRVELIMRRYIELRLSRRAGETTDISNASYAECWSLAKRLMGSDDDSPFMNGLLEIDKVRRHISNSSSYRLNVEDMSAITHVMDEYSNYLTGCDPHNLVDRYCAFCDFSFNQFRGSLFAWQVLIRKLDGKQEPQLDWKQFARDYSVHD